MSENNNADSSANSSTSHLWGGRFSEATDAFVQRFTASVTFDRRLYRHDIQGSIAHAQMLAKVGLLTAENMGEFFMIRNALRQSRRS